MVSIPTSSLIHCVGQPYRVFTRDCFVSEAKPVKIFAIENGRNKLEKAGKLICFTVNTFSALLGNVLKEMNISVSLSESHRFMVFFQWRNQQLQAPHV